MGAGQRMAVSVMPALMAEATFRLGMIIERGCSAEDHVPAWAAPGASAGLSTRMTPYVALEDSWI